MSDSNGPDRKTANINNIVIVGLGVGGLYASKAASTTNRKANITDSVTGIRIFPPFPFAPSPLWNPCSILHLHTRSSSGPPSPTPPGPRQLGLLKCGNEVEGKYVFYTVCGFKRANKRNLQPRIENIRELSMFCSVCHRIG